MVIKEFRFCLLFLILLLPYKAESQTGIVRGFVADSLSGEVLPFANVLILELNTGTSTDHNGYFLITSVPPNTTYTLIASYIGYSKKQIKIKVSPNKTTYIDIRLEPTGVRLSEIEKIEEYSTKQKQMDISVNRIKLKDLEYIPQGVETDIFRSLRTLPGVQSTGDISARFYVRGGASNQNLVLFNDAPVYNPFHAFGLFSVVDPEMVNNLEFYKGGFPTQYNGRLSSVLKIITKDGNKNNYSSTFSISQLAAKMLVEGPLPHGSFIFTGRKSFNTNVLRKFLNDKDAPVDFHDLSFKATYSNPDFMATSKFSFYGFISGDFLNQNDQLLEDFSWKNNLLGFKWFHASDSPLFLELSIYISNFYGSVEPNLSGVNERKNELNDTSIKMDFTYMFDSKDEIMVGLNVSDISTNLFLKNQFGTETNLTNYGTDFSAYIKYRLLQFDNLGCDIGTRLNMVNLIGGNSNKYSFEPRINFSYKLFGNLTFRAAWGIYQQELTTLSDETEIISLFEPWVIAPSYIGSAKSVHYIGGIEYDFSDKTLLRAETYYKFVHNYPSLNNYKFEETDPDLIKGSLESSGIEFQFLTSIENLKLSSTYSFSRSYKTVNGWIYYPKYDSRHSFNINASYEFVSDWTFSLYWIFSSALPFTQSRGYYDKLFFDNLYQIYPVFESYKPFAVLDDVNLGRLTNYHRLDLSIGKKFKIGFVDAEADLNAMNVYNRKNIFYFKRDTGEKVYMLPFLVTANLKISI
jgi:hypothetical protein